MEKIDFLELYTTEYEDSEKKNHFIQNTSGDYIVFLRKEAATKEEVEEIIVQEDLFSQSDVLVFGSKVPTESSLENILMCGDMEIFALCIRRQLFARTGKFNEKLRAATNLELLLRLAKVTAVTFIPCDSMDIPAEKFENAGTYAYMLYGNMEELKSRGVLDVVFERVMEITIREGNRSHFEKTLTRMLENREIYTEINKDTAPFLVISGDETCYGVLQSFAICLAQGLKELGEAVIMSRGQDGKQINLEIVKKMTWKGIIGFQAPALELPFFRELNAPKFQFLFDNPFYFDDLCRDLPSDYFLLCQDGDYAECAKKYNHVVNALHFPPGGIAREYVNYEPKTYEISFIGTYYPADMPSMDEFHQKFAEYMIANPKWNFEEGMLQFLKENHVSYEKEDFLKIIWAVTDVFKYVTNYYRHLVVETILEAGFSLHVFGESWHRYNGKGKENLVVHPAVTVEESLDVLAHSRIGLNIMTWHKAGMTERIANIMLSGAVCVSDETSYLREHFMENQEIVLFELDKLQELPQKIAMILENDDLRQKITRNAYKNASANHTWKQRAESLLELI